MRLEPLAGGIVDLVLARADSTFVLVLRPDPAAPAPPVRLAAESGRWYADSIARLVNRNLAAGETAALRIPDTHGRGVVELVRSVAAGAPGRLQLRAAADSAAIDLRPDEARGLARLMRRAAVTLAPMAEDSVAANGPYFEFQVEKPVVAAPGGCFPRYPEDLRRAGVRGEVRAQYIVDTDGRAEPESFRVLSTSHTAFSESVKAALFCMRFLPAEMDGRKVRQLVQQPFNFDLARP